MIAMTDLMNSEIEFLIREFVHSEKYRRILHRRFIDGITYEQIGDECDMSVRQVKQIAKEESDALMSKIKSH